MAEKPKRSKLQLEVMALAALNHHVARYVAAEFHRKQDDYSVCVWELPGSAAHRECLRCDAPDCILLT